MKLYILLGILLATTLFAKEWTIMVFLNGDNNLDSFAFQDINELEQIGSNDNINIIVQYDRFVANSEANWGSAKRFYINQDSDSSVISSDEIVDLGEVDSGDYHSVVDFVRWSKDNYPADKYALVIWDHGSGWQKKSLAAVDFNKSISSDDTSGNHISVASGDYEAMLFDIKGILGKKLDFLGLDACLMGMWEVAYSSEKNVEFMAFSEELENGTGWQYDSLITQFINTDLSAKNLCKSVVNSSLDSVGATLSCIDLSLIPVLTGKINNFATNFKTDHSIDLEILTAYANTLNMEDDIYYKDLGGFFKNLSLLTDENIKTQWITPILDALNSAVVLKNGNVTEIADYSKITGLTIFMPFNYSSEEIASYNSASWSDETDWNEFITREFSLTEDEYEEDNTIETAYYNQTLEETNHSIHVNDDVDFIKVELKEGSDYTFETICGGYDTFITLLSEDGSILSEDDDSGEDRCSKISYYSENTVFAFIKVNTYDYESIAMYSLKISEDERIDDFPNSINKVAQNDVLTDNIKAEIQYENDIDFFYIDANAVNTYTIETVEDTLNDTLLYIYDSEGNLITENDDISTSLKNYMSKVSFTPEKSGKYYIAVRAYEDNLGSYKIKLNIENTCTQTNNGIEICDGVDNDCDGIVDNNMVEVKSDNQKGVCLDSKKVCDGVNGWIEPDYKLITNFEENEFTCDGKDNDCDGEVDDNLIAPDNKNQKGVCLNSKQFCSGREGWREFYLFVENYSTKDDTNDGLDNNCNGEIDEAYIGPEKNSGCSFSSNNNNKTPFFFILLLFLSIFKFKHLIYKK